MFEITVYLPAMDAKLNSMTSVSPWWQRRLRYREESSQDSLLTQLGLAGLSWSDLPSSAELLAWSKGLVTRSPLLALAPLHLLVDLREIYIGPEPVDDLTAEERFLFEEVWRPCFASHGLTLLSAEDGSWFLQRPEPIDLNTKSATDVYGHPLSACLPETKQHADWVRLMTEIQMLCHDHPVNRSRRERGQATCDALWFYGAGPSLTNFVKPTPPSEVLSTPLMLLTDDEVISALVRYLEIPRYSVDDHPVNHSVCYYYSRMQSPVKLDALLCLLTPLIESAYFSRFRLYLGEKACYDLHRHNLKWWRKWC
jgi:hypothetical protein